MASVAQPHSGNICLYIHFTGRSVKYGYKVDFLTVNRTKGCILILREGALAVDIKENNGKRREVMDYACPLNTLYMPL